MMLRKPIALGADNRDAVEAALREVNGTARSFTVTALDEVVNIAARATQYLDARHVRLKDRTGAVARYTPSGPTAKKYAYDAASTIVVLRLGADGRTWRLASVDRTTVSPRQSSYLGVFLTTMGHKGWMETCAGAFGIERTPEEIEVARQAEMLRQTEARLAAERAREAEEADADFVNFAA